MADYEINLLATTTEFVDLLGSLDYQINLEYGFQASTNTGNARNSFVFDQPTPATTWTVVHTLGFRPNVTVVSPAGIEFFPSVEFVSDTQILIRVGATALAGFVYLS